MADDVLDDPSDWPAEHAHLRELDRLLRCPVCKEYFATAMVTAACSHTFCSLCIRRCLTQETKCPSCRAPLTEAEIRPNRIVDSLLRAFTAGRPQLLAALARSPEAPAPPPCADDARKRARIRTRSAARAASDGAGDSDGGGSGSDFAPDAGRRPAAVPCPNCEQTVQASQINRHLDRCLAGKAAAAGPGAGTPRQQPALRLQAPPAAGPALPRPTKLAYSLLSESRLRRTLRELGIPTRGDKQQMQARHVEWVNMYMANADAAAPVSHRVLLRRLAAWEDALLRPPADAAHHPPSTPDTHAEKYADAFTALVAQARPGRRPSAT
ncbi:E3 ubiquitin-protein ligase rad18 [Coemansia javaensis]|uniref:Postreplication repair E3 ubiquitin-protein ligase RAD18 n=1 Tax=Coemansia javaensis TaxID=2761396 RepID=A0A9W8LHE5_9FUNG|nr:E3 ubiquitin-protein ligase rad18 [Coemansia javaensis]